MDGPAAAQIRQALARIVTSDGFVRSRRLSQYLTWLVEQSLEGGEISEHAIGRAVYDRGPEFDPQTDGGVRVETWRLRRKLLEYYDGPGHVEAVRIEIPKGGYEPRFEFRAVTLQPAQATASTSSPVAPRSLAMAAAVTVLLLTLHPSRDLRNPDTAQIARLEMSAEAALRNSEYLEARNLLHRAIADGASDASVYAALALAEEELGYVRRAAEAARIAQASRSSLSGPEQLRVAARIRIGQGAWNEAIYAAKELARQEPGDPEAGILLAFAQMRAYDLSGSLQALRNVRALPGANGDPRLDRIEAIDEAHMGHMEEALEPLRRSERKARVSGARMLYARDRILEAGILYNLARPDEAEQAWTDAFHLSEQLGDKLSLVYARRLRGNVLFDRSGDMPAALAEFRRALPEARELGDARELRTLLEGEAVTLRELERPAEAADAVDEAMRVSREASIPMFGLFGIEALLALDRGELADAELITDESLALAKRSDNPQWKADALLSAAWTRIVAGDRRPAEAMNDEARTIIEQERLNAWDWSLQMMRAELARGAGDVAGARQALEVCARNTRVPSSSLWARAALTRLLIEHGSLDEARNELVKLPASKAEDSPSSALAEKALAALLAARSGESASARTLAQQAEQRVRPDTPAYYRALANMALNQAVPRERQAVIWFGPNPGPAWSLLTPARP